MQEIMKLTALQLGAAIRRVEVSPTEAVKAALERIEETAGTTPLLKLRRSGPWSGPPGRKKELAAGRLAGPWRGPHGPQGQHLHQRGVHYLRLPDPGRVPPPYDATLVERLEGAGPSPWAS